MNEDAEAMMMEKCSVCDGSGLPHVGAEDACPACEGDGTLMAEAEVLRRRVEVADFLCFTLSERAAELEAEVDHLREIAYGEGLSPPPKNWGVPPPKSWAGP